MTSDAWTDVLETQLTEAIGRGDLLEKDTKRIVVAELVGSVAPVRGILAYMVRPRALLRDSSPTCTAYLIAANQEQRFVVWRSSTGWFVHCPVKVCGEDMNIISEYFYWNGYMLGQRDGLWGEDYLTPLGEKLWAHVRRSRPQSIVLSSVRSYDKRDVFRVMIELASGFKPSSKDLAVELLPLAST